MSGVPDGPALRDLQRQIGAIKRETQLEYLAARIGFARDRGDLATALQAEATLDALKSPPAPSSVVQGPKRKGHPNVGEGRP